MTTSPCLYKGYPIKKSNEFESETTIRKILLLCEETEDFVSPDGP